MAGHRKNKSVHLPDEQTGIQFKLELLDDEEDDEEKDLSTPQSITTSPPPQRGRREEEQEEEESKRRAGGGGGGEKGGKGGETPPPKLECSIAGIPSPQRKIIRSEPKPHQSPHGTIEEGDIALTPPPSSNFSSYSSSPLLLRDADHNATPEIVRDDCAAIVEFLTQYTCYHVMPVSGKTIIVDTRLSLRAAYSALLENNIKSAPVWDMQKREFVGVMTATEYLLALLYMFNHLKIPPSLALSPEVPSGSSKIRKHTRKSSNMSMPVIQMDMQESTPISLWRATLQEHIPRQLFEAAPNDTLLTAAEALLKHKIHRLPIIDREFHNTVLHVLTYSRMLKFYMKNVKIIPDIFQCSIGWLRVGTFGSLHATAPSAPLSQVMNMMAKYNISSIPILDSNGVLLDVFSKQDVAGLANKKDVLSLLEKPVIDVLQMDSQCSRAGAYETCKLSHSLLNIMSTLFAKRRHRTYCLSEEGKIIGVVSVSDILGFFVRNGTATTTGLTEEQDSEED